MNRQQIAALCLAFLGTFLTSGQISVASENRPPEGAPGRRVGAGVRGPEQACINGNHAQIAVIPETHLALTSQAYPSFLFYLPQVNTDRTLEFVLRDESDREIYDQTVLASGEAGIIRLELPQSKAVALEPEKSYRWYFSIICNANDRSQDITAHGWIRRTTLSTPVVGETATDPSIQIAQAYADSGLWLDAFAELDYLRRSEPSRSRAQGLWETWLSAPSIDLPELAQEMPIASPFTDGQ